MAKGETTKGLDTLEKAVEKLQQQETERCHRDAERFQQHEDKLSALEADVKEIKQQLGRLDILERLEKKLLGEERLQVKLGKRPEEETQTSEMEEGHYEGSHLQGSRGPTREAYPPRYPRDPEDRNDALTRRIEIPIFDGESVASWILKVEQYFELSDFTEREKLRAVRMCFDGEALTWYRWERDRNPFRSWEQMKNRVLESFSTAHDLSPGEMLLALEGSAGEYCRDFIALASNAPDVPENVLEMAFMTGLQPKTRAGIKMFEPRSLNKMMNFAKMVEDWSGKGELPSEKSFNGSGRSTRFFEKEMCHHTHVVSDTWEQGHNGQNHANLI